MRPIEIEWFKSLAEVWPEWSDLEFTAQTLAYPLMGELAREVAEAIDTNDLATVRELFRVIEESLVEGRDEIYQLIAVGLFESLTDIAFHRFEPPDLLDDYLGDLSLDLWRIMIEGWTAPGVRSIAQLRAFHASQ